MVNKSINDILSKLKQIQRTNGSWIVEIYDIRYSYMHRGKTWRDLKVMMIRRGATLQEY
jgi:hypothetical protein